MVTNRSLTTRLSTSYTRKRSSCLVPGKYGTCQHATFVLGSYIPPFLCVLILVYRQGFLEFGVHLVVQDLRLVNEAENAVLVSLEDGLRR